MSTRRSLRTRNNLTSKPSPPAPVVSPRPRRSASGPGKQVTIARESSDSPEGAKKAIHLTVKMPANKLREATSSGRGPTRDGLEPADIITGPRSNRGKKSYVVESESDDEDEEEEEEEEAEEDIPVEDQIGEPEATDDDIDADEDDDDEEPEQDAAADEDDAESGSVEEDEDVEMEDESPMPPPPVFKMTEPALKPRVTVTPAKSGKLKGVEEKEMEAEEDDEDLSSINSEGDGEDDAEGEEIEDVDEMDQDEADIPSAGVGSRASTPDVSKMTKRQKSRLSEVMGNDFLQLPMEPQIKKHLTAEEHAMRRAEMARRRKNLSEKRNEEEKADTINRLLKKQAPKRRGKISQAEITANAVAGVDTTLSEEPEVENANPVFVRWISDAKGCRVGVPSEWLEGPAGRVFGGLPNGASGQLVTEV